MASGKEILSSFNPLLAFTHSQDHPQKGLSTKMESKRVMGINLEHCHLWGTGRGGRGWVKSLVLGLTHTMMTF